MINQGRESSKAVVQQVPLILGIAGGTGSGKTTVARSLIELIGPENIAYLEHDNYYRDLSHLSFEERAQVNFDHPDSFDTEFMIEHNREFVPQGTEFKYFNDEQVKCIPIGYKSGISSKSTQNRKYKWTFIGTPHKSSRHDLLFQFSEIKPFYIHKTEKFDKKIISVDEMNELLSSTEFIPCPNGFFHPETYRLYEALECGCIPIVENAYKYYDRLFPNNPFIKIDRWIEAKPIINGWGNDQIEKKREECSSWWANKKNEIQNFIESKII